ncbi:E3 ubiquitin-protein ligase RNF138 [Neoarius graeffei]|uniref:E3 ubiquitin-protein ligase RNF138 n=1 Tax=Neoarius graeffei TaxID=443677 RepID=UPI00298C91C2|nr:E3 ubiquitin-protein ligase RNF138 [Neoarius graeffei]
MDSTTDDDCPVCRGPLQNPSEPVPCCRKVFCQSCLKQAILARPQCPYCRTPITNRATLAFRSAIRTIRLSDDSLRTTRTVSPNLQALLNQLQAANARSSRTASTSDVSLSNQDDSNAPVQGTGPSVIRPLRRPVPTPRVQTHIQVAPAAPATTPAPNPISVQANTSPQSDLQPDNQDYMNILRTYDCPYCQEGGLDDLDLRDHCNNNHLNDPRQVVCPVCVSLPHGNPLYTSRNFIGHLNLRHSYYIDDITNIYQNDDVNLQDALLRSWQIT